MRLVFCCLIAFVALLPLPARAADIIGTIMEVEGSATISPQGGAPVKARVQDTIGVDDIVAAGPKSKVFILLIDDTEITLSENARFKATEYQFDDEDTSDNKARYSFLSGAFEYISGLMTKKPDPDVGITTPFGSIGVRGTRLWAGDLDSGYGVHVDEGVVDVSNAGGKVRLGAGFGTDIAGPRSAPTKAAGWSRQRRQGIMARVALKDPQAVADRIAAHRARQQELRAQYRTALRQRRSRLRDNGAINKTAPNTEGGWQQLLQRRRQRRWREQ